MLEFKKKVDDRKILKKRLEELTGTKAVYTYVPRCAYLAGDYAIEMDGRLTVEEDKADRQVIRTLIDEGLIEGQAEAGDAGGTASMQDAEGAGLMQTVESGEAVETERTEEGAAILETGESRETQEAEETVEAGEAEEAEDAVDAEEAGEAEEAVETMDTEGTEALCDYNAVYDLAISLPAGSHNAQTLRNLVNTIYSRGKLLTKATGGHFGIDAGLLKALDEAGDLYTAEDFRRAVGMYEDSTGGPSMTGLVLTPEKVIFTGFPQTDSPEKTKAFMQLAERINSAASRQKRIAAKAVDDTNERYSFRVWMVRIGMGGGEFKEARRILLEPLAGHSAFRTPEDAEKAKQKRLAAKTSAADASGSAPAEDAVETTETEGATGAADGAEAPAV